MVSSDLWTDINSRSGEIFIMITEKPIDGLSVMTVAEGPKLTLQIQISFYVLISKIIEKFIHKQTSSFLCNNKIL